MDVGGGITPETGVGQTVHGVILDNQYDFSSDPLGLRKLAAQGGIDDRNYWFNRFESSILDAGFDGVYVPGAQGS